MLPALPEILLIATVTIGVQEPAAATPTTWSVQAPMAMRRLELTRPGMALPPQFGVLPYGGGDPPKLRLPGHSLGLAEHAWAQGEPWKYLVAYEVPRRLGGFSNLAFDASSYLSTGPEVAWMTPEAPTENWQQTAVVMPGWAIWYRTPNKLLGFGLSTCTRLLMTQQSGTLIDPLTSLARLAVYLP